MSAVLATLVLIFVVETTTPSSLGPLGILGVFLLTYIILLGIISWILIALNRLILRFAKIIRTRKPIARMSFLRSYYFASVVSIGVVMLLAMGSVKSLGVYEIVLVIIFIIISTFYIAKRT